jgi:endonuclease/exonuclease/phosphatase family metal-dependent hydrolase
MIFTFVTYNIWFDNYLMRQRMKQIIQIFKNEQPDIICLQEVTPNSLQILMDSLFIVDNYYFSLTEMTQCYDTLILVNNTKFNVINTNIYDFGESGHSMMGRGYHHMEIEFKFGDEHLNIVTSHLESEFKKDAKNKLYQYKYILDKFKNTENVVFAGDLNIPNYQSGYYDKIAKNMKWFDSWIEMSKTIPKDYAEDIRWTYDCNKNSHRGGSRKNNHSRLDRVLYKNAKFTISAMQLIGTDKSVHDYEQDKHHHPSDHFGLLCDFQMV